VVDGHFTSMLAVRFSTRFTAPKLWLAARPLKSTNLRFKIPGLHLMKLPKVADLAFGSLNFRVELVSE